MSDSKAGKTRDKSADPAPHSDGRKTAGKADSNARAPKSRQDGTRETVESIVFAFILAFLFRTFEAEAFVIPTGSMAPTLYGRHIDVECPQCGHPYAVGASEEVDNDGYLIGQYVDTAICPNCRYETHVKDIPGTDTEFLPVFKGDRILVNKFPYEFGDPARWDVVVFKYPESPSINFIKRLVGLPGETIEIRQGDVYARRGKNAPAKLLRKDDPDKQRELRILVYDDAHPARLLHELGWPERWAAVEKGSGSGEIAGWSDDESGWTHDAAARSFHLEKSRADEPHWIRYRHIVPEEDDWGEALSALAQKREARFSVAKRVRLISDFTGYNAYTTRTQAHQVEEGVRHGLFWVGDLTLTCRVDLGEADENGQLVFELNEGGRWYRCTLDVSTGEAVLSHFDEQSLEELPLSTAATDLRADGSYEVSFANVDDRLCLWIDGDLVEFPEGGVYSPMGGPGDLQKPTTANLAPIGIAARGVEATVSRLLIERDIYYRAEILAPESEYESDRDETGRGSHYIHEYDVENERSEFYTEALWSKLNDPTAWFAEYRDNLSSAKEKYAGRIRFEFELGPDEFFMMGDNSPRSKDSRLWGNSRHAAHRHAVPRSALVGKAFFIYWPHGEPFLNDGMGYPEDGDSILNTPWIRNLFYHQRIEQDRQGRTVTETTDYPSTRIPFYPHFSRMHRIR